MFFTLYALYFTQSPPPSHPKERIICPQNLWSELLDCRASFASLRHTTDPHSVLTRMLAEECFIYSSETPDVGSSSYDSLVPDIRGMGRIRYPTKDFPLSTLEKMYKTATHNIDEVTRFHPIHPVESVLSPFSDPSHPSDGPTTLYRHSDQSRSASYHPATYQRKIQNTSQDDPVAVEPQIKQDPEETWRKAAPVGLAALPPPLAVAADASLLGALGPRAHEAPVILHQNRSGLSVRLRKKATRYAKALSTLQASMVYRTSKSKSSIDQSYLMNLSSFTVPKGIDSLDQIPFFSANNMKESLIESVTGQSAEDAIEDPNLWKRICIPLVVQFEESISSLVSELELSEVGTAQSVKAVLKSEIKPKMT